MTNNEQSGERTEQTVLVGNDGGFGLPEAREFERDDGTTGIIPPDEVFLRPLRTRANGWKKYHTIEGCGSENVYYVEDPSPMRTSERYDWELYCMSCGHGARWQDVLFISEEWYEDRRHAKEAWDWRMFDKLHLSEEQAVELGPDPNEAELIQTIGEAWERYQERVEEWQNQFPITEETNE